MLTGVLSAVSMALCHVLTHGGVAIASMSIMLLLRSLSKMKVISEAETSSHGLDHYFYYAPILFSPALNQRDSDLL